TSDGDRVFLMWVAEQAQRGWLGREFVTRQKSEFGEPSKEIACGTVVCLLVLASLVRRDAKESGHKICGTNASVPSLELLRVSFKRRAKFDHLAGRAVEDTAHKLGKRGKVLSQLGLSKLRLAEDIRTPSVPCKLDRMLGLQFHGFDE